MRFRCGKTVTGLIFGGLFVVFPTFATSYSYDVDVKFNFNSKLAVTITDADIKILDLAPGTSADSNVVGITISTNNVTGYTAEATVGNAQNATTDMTHTNGTNTFASIATNASQASLTADNTWGYSISTDNGSSWSNFSGLPIYTADGKELASTNSPASDAIKFKINAKAATSQPAGDYTNVINFKVVANTPSPDWTDVDPCLNDPTKCDTETGKLAIQNVDEELCDFVGIYDTQYQVTDLRDHKNYWISKLRDGHCWMTQNLDLDLETTPTNVAALTSENTDLNTWDGRTNDNKYTAADGYSETDGVITWTPPQNTLTPSSSGTFTWANNQDFVKSVDVGNWFQTTEYFASSNCPNAAGCNFLKGNGKGYFYQNDSPSAEEMHYHIGNYYNWISAVATNTITEFITITYGDTSNNPKNSICPKGWRMPVIARDTTKDDYVGLTQEYPSSDTNKKDLGIWQSPLYFIRGGVARDNTIQYAGNSMAYYSSTISSADSTSTTADEYSLDASTTLLELKKNQEGWRGRFVRCIAR